MPMKIAYVIDSLASKGGAERILSEKMSYLATHLGYEVFVITCYQNPAHEPNVYPLSEKVRQIDLVVPFYSQYKVGYPMRLLAKWRLYRQLKKRLAETVREIDPDVLVGVGYFRADMVTALKCRAKKVVELHEARFYTMSGTDLHRSLLPRLYMQMYRWWYLRAVENRADAVVPLTTSDAYQWRRAKKVVVIPNFTMMPVSDGQQAREKRVIAVGRLEWQKGFDRLVDIWARVAGNHPDWHLDIFGSGTQQAALQQQIASLGLTQQMTIHPFTNHIREEYLRSSVFVLTSRYEGFSLALLEAAQNGLPSVAFDCPFGPAGLIAEGQSGFLVPCGDVSTFAERLELLLSDETLRQRCSRYAVGYVQKYDIRAVMQQLDALFKELCSTPEEAT